jgi:hypothetical protein
VTLAERIVELHRALASADIPHAFGGAVALAYWTAEPRGTRDIDVNVFLPATESGPALEALPTGVAAPEGTSARIARDGQIRLWWDGTPVDLFFSNVPVHDQAARHSRTAPFEGTRIPILGPVELAAFKAMFGRTRDWADIEAMIAAETLDLDAVRATLSDMLGSDDEQFARLDEAVRRARDER